MTFASITALATHPRTQTATMHQPRTFSRPLASGSDAVDQPTWVPYAAAGTPSAKIIQPAGAAEQQRPAWECPAEYLLSLPRTVCLQCRDCIPRARTSPESHYGSKDQGHSVKPNGLVGEFSGDLDACFRNPFGEQSLDACGFALGRDGKGCSGIFDAATGMFGKLSGILPKE